MLQEIKRFFAQVIERVGAPFAVVTTLVLAPAILFLPKLGSLVPTGSTFEQLEYLGAESGSAFYGDMLNAPLRAAQYGVSLLSDNATYLRLVSAAVATLASICLFLFIKRWHTLRVATLATCMFITSSWVLHDARFANTDVLYLLVVPALFLVGSWTTSKNDEKKLPLSILLLAVVLYVPGAWLFLIGGMIVMRSHVKRIWSKISIPLRIIGVALLAILSAPLVVSFVHRPSHIIEWLGVSNYSGLSFHEVGTNLLSLPKELLISGPEEATNWLTGTPVLDIFAIAMFIIGCYAYRTGDNPIRERLVFGSLIIGIVLVAIGGPSSLGLIIPLIYVVIASGITYMLQSWFTVFPRNPLARSIGLSLIFITVLVSCSYQLQRYFIAWPNSPAIEQLRQ